MPRREQAKPSNAPAGLQRVIIGVLLCVGLIASLARAGAETVLTLSRGPGDAETLELSLEDLEAMPQTTIVTENVFEDGAVTYTGPLVRDVIDRLSLGQAETLRFTAANDYYIEIPTSDFLDYDAILALAADGVKLSRRDKGPLWLMYPISGNPALRDPVYIHRLIWQVIRIEPL